MPGCDENPGRAREGRSPLELKSSPATCAVERLLAQRASKSLRDRQSEIKDFGLSPGLFLRRKISFSRAKIDTLQFPRPKIRRILAETGGGSREAENPRGFSGFAFGKTATAQIEDLRRGTWRGSLLPRPPACQKDFFDKLLRRSTRRASFK